MKLNIPKIADCHELSKIHYVFEAVKDSDDEMLGFMLADFRRTGKRNVHLTKAVAQVARKNGIYSDHLPTDDGLYLVAIRLAFPLMSDIGAGR